MVYTVSIRNLDFKMDLSDAETMLGNQQATYAILKHAKDVPDSVFFSVIGLLAPNIEDIYHRKLKVIVSKYKKAVAPVGISMSDELVGSIIVENGMARYEEDGEVIWSRNVEPAIEIGAMDDDDEFELDD